MLIEMLIKPVDYCVRGPGINGRIKKVMLSSVLLAADGRNDLAEVGVARNSVSHCPAKSALRPQTRNRISSYLEKIDAADGILGIVGRERS